MSITFLPKTKSGKVSVGSFVTFIVSWNLDDFLHTTMAIQSFLVIAGIMAVLLGFVTGIIALLWKKDYSVLLLIVTLLCFLMSFIVIAFLGEGW